MNILVFVTDDGSPEGTGPMLFIEEKADAVLPQNPRSYPWRYFATVGREDGMIEADDRAAIARDGSRIVNRILGCLRVA